jgi:hypothetical protein
VFRTFGTGDSRVFRALGGGQFLSMPEDFGTLVRDNPYCDCGGYTYTDTHQQRWLQAIATRVVSRGAGVEPWGPDQSSRSAICAMVICRWAGSAHRARRRMPA